MVWRWLPTGIEVVLVHRPAYDDWALPKGKAEATEPDEVAALREVAEETGLDCSLGVELTSTTYTDAEGRDKTVRYWSMTSAPSPATLRPAAAAEGEIDAVAWLPLEEARLRLTYPRDVVVLDSFEQSAVPRSTKRAKS